MAQNNIESLSELDSLAGIPLVRLALNDNKITTVKNYRLYAIHVLPTLRVLDFTRITQKVCFQLLLT